MTITYRTAGAWGGGTGFDLPAATIDANFWDLHGRIVLLEDWPTPAGIDYFDIDNVTGELTVVMDDYTTRGPYQLPIYVPSAFVWAPAMAVVPGQMFAIGATIYTVIFAHTTVDPFDPAENNGLGDNYYQEFITVDGVLPTGGATGQALVKSSATDYAVTWSFAVIPPGGTAGQIIRKLSGTDYDTDWDDNDLDGLSDVVTGTPDDGDVLRYSGSDSVWSPEALDAIEVADIGVTVQAYDAQLSSLIRQRIASSDTSVAATDVAGHILHPSADTTARTWGIPSNATVPLTIGSAVTFVNQNAAGVITITIATDTMRLAGAGTTGNRSLAANGVATALKVTATEWLISGTGLT